MPRIKKQHLKRRKDGRFCCRYKDQFFYGDTEDEALDAREQYKRLEKQGFFSAENRNVSDFAEPWLKRITVSASDQTYREKAILLEKLLNHIGNLRISDVRSSDIKEVYSSEFAGKSASYIRSASQLYKSLFDAAQDDGYCDKNPAREKSAAPHAGTIGSHRAITDQERKWIETLCTGHRAHAVVMAMLYAGIRPQEAKALNIDRDVDFKAGTICIRESVHIDGYNQYTSNETLKTQFSKRTIPLLPPLREALLNKKQREQEKIRQKAEKRSERLKIPVPKTDKKPDNKKLGMLIETANGKRVTVQAWKSVWESYVSEMETAINGCSERWYGKKKEHKGKELPPFIHFTVVPYDLRHSFCTMCRDNGVEINTCIHWMGHKDAKMILKIYDEYNAERGKKEAEKLEKSLLCSQNGSQQSQDKEQTGIE